MRRRRRLSWWVRPGGSSFGSISHKGENVDYVIADEIEPFVDDKAYQLSVGDTFCSRSGRPQLQKLRKGEGRIPFREHAADLLALIK